MLNQAAFSNWVGGGANNVGWLVSANYNFTYQKDKEVHILALTQNNITNNQITIQDSIQFKHCYFNPNNREITIEKQKITLSEKETAVLHYLASNLSECVNLYDILEEVWDDSFMEESLRNVISTLRKKIINTGLQITTIKNKGYLLEDNGIS